MAHNGRYTLVGKIAVPCLNLLAWAKWFEASRDERVVGNAHLVYSLDGQEIKVRVSTVFLGLDHQWGNGPPLLFETMIFGGPHDQNQRRYSTWGEAEDGHLEWLQCEMTYASKHQWDIKK